MEKKKWIPEIDACDECTECCYFLDDFWNCQGEPEPCHEFHPKLGSKKKMVEIVVGEEDEGQM